MEYLRADRCGAWQQRTANVLPTNSQLTCGRVIFCQRLILSMCPFALSAGLQPMLPYLVPLLADEVGRNLGDAAQLHVVLRCAC